MKIDRLTNNDLHIIGIAVGRILGSETDFLGFTAVEMDRLDEAFNRLDDVLVTIAGPNWEDKERAE